MNDQQATVILIDNSSSAINGDFYPDRLNALKIAITNHINFLCEGSARTQIGIGTLGSADFGIKFALNNDVSKVRLAVEKIHKYGGNIQLDAGIRCGILALRHRNTEVPLKRIIVFIGSKHDLTPNLAQKLMDDINKEGIQIDIVTFGDDVNDEEVLKNFVAGLKIPSHYIHLPVARVILSDQLALCPIGPGDRQARIDESDRELQMVIEMSKLDAAPNDEDEELKRVLEMSRQETENSQFLDSVRQTINDYNPDGAGDAANDPELQEALQASLLDHQPDRSVPTPAPAQPAPAAPSHDDDIDMDDPELRAALAASMQDNQPQNDDNMNDPELLKAIEASKKDNDPDNVDMNDPELQAALAASMELPQSSDKIKQELDDPDLLNSILSDLPGVDPNSELFKKKDEKKKEDDKKKQ